RRAIVLGESPNSRSVALLTTSGSAGLLPPDSGGCGCSSGCDSGFGCDCSFGCDSGCVVCCCVRIVRLGCRACLPGASESVVAVDNAAASVTVWTTLLLPRRDQGHDFRRAGAVSGGESRLPVAYDVTEGDLGIELAQNRCCPGRHPVDQQPARWQVQIAPGVKVRTVRVAEACRLVLRPASSEVE